MKKAWVGLVLVGAAMRLAMTGAGDSAAVLPEGIWERGALINATVDLNIGAGEGECGETHGQMTAMPEAAGAGEGDRQEKGDNLGERAAASVQVMELSAVPDIRNDTGLSIDPRLIMEENPLSEVIPKGARILIIHTHGSEAYTMTPEAMYRESDPYRTQDSSHNVLRVGEALKSVLEGYGLEVIHDVGIYDYPSYTGSYTRSGAAVESWLEQYPDIGIVIDLHRDAIGSDDVVYKTMAEVEGRTSAQVMLLVGTGENGLAHPNWQGNMALALAMQNAMDEAYPTLARPLALKSERYNQHLTPGSLILEVGSTGNTLEEALCAAELFGHSVGELLAELAADE